MKGLFRKILCPIDFGRISIPAIKLARRLAEDSDAAVCLLCVVPKQKPAGAEPGLEQFATDSLRAVARKWLEGKVRYEIVVRAGKPALAVIKAAEELGADAIVMATHGRTGKARARLGSVTEHVVRQSTRPVITIRPVSTGDGD